jgi:hypothetical protein
MAISSPLQLLLFRHPDDSDVLPYEDAIVRAFQGGKEAGGYLASGGDLGLQLKVFSVAPTLDPVTMLDVFSHTLTIVLVDRELLNRTDNLLWEWLSGCWTHTANSAGRHEMIVLSMDERIGNLFSSKRSSLASLQLLQNHDLGERAIRASMFALRLLHECRVLLARALPTSYGNKAGYLRLFISHAKMDGLPLAHALKHQIEQMKWLENFYDVDDLPPGCDWQKELERGVGSSLIIILRTEGYDSRPWCQQEVFWADEYATPAVLVDARTSLNHPAAMLPFDRLPIVRIPDGNLIRILFLALREGLRFLYFMRQVEQMKQNGALPSPVELRVFCFAPSMSALLRACRSLADAKVTPTIPHFILYPDPTLRAGHYEAAQALVTSYAPSGTRLLTPNTLAVTTGGRP